MSSVKFETTSALSKVKVVDVVLAREPDVSPCPFGVLCDGRSHLAATMQSRQKVGGWRVLLVAANKHGTGSVDAPEVTLLKFCVLVVEEVVFRGFLV